MPQAITMTYINVNKFLVMNEFEKAHSTIQTCRFENVVIFIQTI